MKKKYFLTAGLLVFSVMAFASCNSSTTKDDDSETSQEIEELMEDDTQAAPASELSEYAKIFNDKSKKSENATDSTYAETATGLKYMIVKEGKGASPKATDVVTVHYEGQLTNGYVFDSSYSRGEPTSFPLNRVIPGWTEGLQLMKIGGKTIFYIPSNLGYGPNGMPGAIPPNADLIFTVELLEINK